MQTRLVCNGFADLRRSFPRRYGNRFAEFFECRDALGISVPCGLVEPTRRFMEVLLDALSMEVANTKNLPAHGRCPARLLW